MSNPHIITQDRMLEFILAGKAVFTVRGRDNRFTFKVKQPKFDGQPAENLRFVYVMTGPDNETSYSYIGTLVKKQGNWEYRFNPAKSRLGSDSIQVISFRWLIRMLIENKRLPNELEVWHEGKCGKCGRRLTVPESIETGIGPECSRILAGAR